MVKTPAHHAYLFWQGEPTLKRELLARHLDLDSLDLVHFPSRKLGVEDINQLKHTAQLRPTARDFQLIIVLVDSITIEAQQALLKLLEDPPAQTLFAFFVKQEVILLDTLLSRFWVVNDSQSAILTEAFATFCSMTRAERLALLADKLLKKDTTWVASIKSGLVAYLGQSDRNNQNLKRLNFILFHLATRGAGNKMLLEELALSLDNGKLKDS